MTDGNQHFSIEGDLNQLTKQLVFLTATSPAVEKGLFQGGDPLCCSPGRCRSSVFCREEQTELLSWLSPEFYLQQGGRCCSCNHKKQPERQFPRITALAKSHSKLQCSHPGNAGWVCCTRQLRTTELRNARLCSMIHYSELLNNSACRINGICH